MRKYYGLITVIFIVYIFSLTSCNKMQQIEEMATPVVEPYEIIVEESPVDVLIYVGKTLWIRPEPAKVEAEITKNLLESQGIQVGITGSDDSVRDWMLQTTANEAVNVCILYGTLPYTIYPSGNAQPDDSVLEKWLESTDGDTIMNHADYFGYNSSEGKANERGALQNLMDIPDIEIDVYTHNTKMMVTEEGRTLTPSLDNFASDRTFPLDQFEGEWFAEKILATDTGDAQASFADPIIVRDGDRGRIAIVFHTLYKDNPKGEVAAEIINYLLSE